MSVYTAGALDLSRHQRRPDRLHLAATTDRPHTYKGYCACGHLSGWSWTIVGGEESDAWWWLHTTTHADEDGIDEVSDFRPYTVPAAAFRDLAEARRTADPSDPLLEQAVDDVLELGGRDRPRLLKLPDLPPGWDPQSGNF